MGVEYGNFAFLVTKKTNKAMLLTPKFLGMNFLRRFNILYS